jgi:YVTN family beta-propeller protein
MIARLFIWGSPMHGKVVSIALLLPMLTAANQSVAGMLFISNERDNTVTVIDAATLKVTKTIPVGRRPRGLVISPDFREVLVCALFVQETIIESISSTLKL